MSGNVRAARENCNVGELPAVLDSKAGVSGDFTSKINDFHQKEDASRKSSNISGKYRKPVLDDTLTEGGGDKSKDDSVFKGPLREEKMMQLVDKPPPNLYTVVPKKPETMHTHDYHPTPTIIESSMNGNRY
jgi:hypothetical protein